MKSLRYLNLLVEWAVCLTGRRAAFDLNAADRRIRAGVRGTEGLRDGSPSRVPAALEDIARLAVDRP